MKLNNKDVKIIAQLDTNPNTTLSFLAQKLNTSQQVIDYHLKKLISDKVILQFHTLFNLSKIGYAEYRVLIKLNNVDDTKKHEIIKHLQKHTNVSWAAIVGGKWDLFLIVFVKDYAEFDLFLDKLFNQFSGTLKDYDAVYSLYHEFYSHKYIHEKNTFLKPTTLDLASPAVTVDLDVVDLSICNSIKTNCRLSTVELGRSCGTNYKTVQNRIKKLEQQGLIAGYRLLLASEILGYKAIILLISFQSYTSDLENKLFKYARNNQFITQALKLFGRWNVLFHIRVKDDKTLQTLIIEIRNLYPIIRDYEIIPVFEDVTMDTFPMTKI